MNAKDRAFLMNALIECNASFERAGRFVSDKASNDRLIEIASKVSKEELNLEIAKLKKGLGYGNTLQG